MKNLKKCKGYFCGFATKPVEEFSYHYSNADQRCTKCKECQKHQYRTRMKNRKPAETMPEVCDYYGNYIYC